tara:strand:+ start:11919 stop:12581 length:663 start_codon:yes stop_codon:yes gene_type:complete
MDKLINLAHQLGLFVVGMEGNVSHRKGSFFFIKASGAKLKDLHAVDLVSCHLSGEQINPCGPKKSSIETSFHSLIFNKTRAAFIAHTHPINTLKILSTPLIEEFANNRLFPDQVVFNGAVSLVVPYASPGLDLMHQIDKHLTLFQAKFNRDPKLILLKNHGIICIGATAEDCLISTQICEKAAEIFVGAKQLKDIDFLSERDIVALENDTNEIYRQSLIK